MPERIVPDFVVDVSSFRDAAKQLRQSKAKLAGPLRAELRAIGELVAADARERVAPFSESVPPSVKVRLYGLSVAVVAGGGNVPLAGLLELGNADGAGAPRQFRAPNFPPRGSRGPAAFIHGGHDQRMHPFLLPAAQAHQGEIEGRVADLLLTVFGGAYLSRE